MRYFIYARKSTDDEDRQVLSIEAQLKELREYAQRENLTVISEIIEAKTAKKPGRPLFNPDFALGIKFNGKRGAKINEFTKQTIQPNPSLHGY